MQTPSVLKGLLKGVGTALITPFHFSVMSGHFRSSIFRRAQKLDGEPIPWFTYPAIEMLVGLQTENADVLEFGAGQSTLYWMKRAASVTSFEGSQRWFQNLKGLVDPNVSLVLAESSGDARVEKIRESLMINGTSRLFDIAVVDGMDRARLARLSVQHLKRDGLLICDNSNGYGIGPALAPYAMHRIDFWGYAPGVFTRHCTSFYFWPECNFFPSTRPIQSELQS